MGGIVSRPPGIVVPLERDEMPKVDELDSDLNNTVGVSPSRSLGVKETSGIPISTSLEALLLNADTLLVQDFIKKNPDCSNLPNSEELVRLIPRTKMLNDMYS